MSSNSNANKNATSRLFGEPTPVDPDPVQDYLFKYNLNGNDSALTRFGGDDFRSGPATEFVADEIVAGKSSWFMRSSSQYYTSADTTLTNVGAGAHTVCFFAKTINLVNPKGVGGTGSGNDQNSFRLRIKTSGEPQYRIDSTSLEVLTFIADGEWHHVAFVVSGSGGTITIYVDGVAETPIAIPTYNLNGSGQLEVGANEAANTFDGGLDDFRFYNRALSGAEILSLSNYRNDFQPPQILPVFNIDASYLSTITESSGSVSQIDDRTVNGLDATQTVAGSRPQTLNEDINGLNVVDFNTAALDTDFFDLPDMSSYIDGSDNRFYMFVARSDDPILRHYLFNSGPNLVNGDRFTIASDNSNMAIRIGGANSVSSLDMSTDGIYAVGLDGTTLGDCVFWKNGISEQAVGTGSINTDGSVNNAIGNRIFNSSAKWTGVVGEFITLNEYPTTERREELEGYLAWKWGLVSLLPGGHTYKTNPPAKVS
jgi:hypothetical protein